MTIFICWSSKASKSVAIALRSFLIQVNKNWKPWVSQTDIHAGTAWRDELRSALEASSFGIVCADQQSLRSPWVHFEAGVLSASISGGRICPFLVDASQHDLTGGPLSDFQSVEATRRGTSYLLRSIQISFPDEVIPERDVELRADDAWPAFQIEINKAISEQGKEPIRPTHNYLDIDGFKALINIHLTATMGRLTFIIEEAIGRSGKVPIKELIREVERDIRSEIIHRRSYLSRFSVDGLGPVVDILDKNFTIHEIRDRLKKARKPVMKSPDPRRMIYKAIRDEQALLEHNLEVLIRTHIK